MPEMTPEEAKHKYDRMPEDMRAEVNRLAAEEGMLGRDAVRNVLTRRSQYAARVGNEAEDDLRPTTTGEHLTAAATGAADFASGGALPALVAAHQKSKGDTRPFSEVKADAVQTKEDLNLRSPMGTLAGQTLGLVTPLAAGRIAASAAAPIVEAGVEVAPKALGLGRTMLEGAKGGAPFGAMAGAGTTESGNPLELTARTGAGAGLGGLGGGALGLAGKGLAAAGDDILSTIRQMLGREAPAAAPTAAPVAEAAPGIMQKLSAALDEQGGLGAMAKRTAAKKVPIIGDELAGVIAPKPTAPAPGMTPYEQAAQEAMATTGPRAGPSQADILARTKASLAPAAAPTPQQAPVKQDPVTSSLEAMLGKTPTRFNLERETARLAAMPRAEAQLELERLANAHGSADWQAGGIAKALGLRLPRGAPLKSEARASGIDQGGNVDKYTRPLPGSMEGAHTARQELSGAPWRNDKTAQAIQAAAPQPTAAPQSVQDALRGAEGDVIKIREVITKLQDAGWTNGAIQAEMAAAGVM